MSAASGVSPEVLGADRPWNRLHYGRTVAAVVALALVGVAALTG